MTGTHPLLMCGLSLCLLGSFSLADKDPLEPRLGVNDVDTIVGHVLTLKEAVDASAKEQWEALQSLRFHMLSARTGLKQALEELETLRQQITECKLAAGVVGREDRADNDEEEDEEEALAPTTTPAASPGCRWPSEEVGGRCLVLVTDQLKTWEDAQQHCRTLGGSLAGKENFSNLQNYLTEQFGLGSELRVRWAVWAGARQTMSGWQWASQECSSAPVDEGVWTSNHPRTSAPADLSLACMSLDGFDGYRGVTTPCTAFRRFVCDLSKGNQ